MEDHFDKTMWHIETCSIIKTPEDSTIRISVMCNPRDSIGAQLTCDVTTTKFDCVQLGEILFKKGRTMS